LHGDAAAAGTEAAVSVAAGAAADWPAWVCEPDGEPEEQVTTAAIEAAPTTYAESLDDDQLAGLVERVCDQHEPSLVRLYEATSGRVYGLVLRVVRQPSLAEEVVEDVFWQVWREAPRFDAGRGKVLAWLLAIARSRAIDALRRQERVRASELAVEDDEALEALAADHGAQEMDPFDLVGASQHHAKLHAVLAALDPLPRQLLSLAFFRGCTHEEIAEQTGLALGTVKSHIRRTLAALRDQLAPQLLVSKA
jgi:RNA polymerase sigma factor (sigma-70 family)